MADNDWWRNESRQHRSRNDDYGSYPDEGYRRGGREGDYRGGDFRRGRGTEGRGDIYGGGAYGSGYREMTGSHGGRDYGGGYGPERYRGSYEDRDYGGGFGSERYGGPYEDRDYRQGYGSERYRGAFRDRDFGRDYGLSRDRDYGGGYGAERYGESYRDYTRGNYERGYGGNDYSRGFYGADQGYRRPDQDTGGYRGERSGWDRFSDEVSSWFGDEDAARRREQDARRDDWSAEHHRGRGPKGYRRSDDRIQEDVNDRLTDDPMVNASEVEVRVSNCEVTLTGTVDSREAKRRAEDCAERVSGVTHVQNNLRVRQQSSGQGTTTGTAGSMTSGSTSGPQGTGLGGVEVGPKGSEATASDRTGPRKTEANT
jgi:osmotically-inducible protein OsmY